MASSTNIHPRAGALKAAVATFTLTIATCVVGCYSPAGGAFPTSGRGFVYISTPTRPVTIAVVDTRTNEPFFAMDIPPGKQLTFKFIEGTGSDARADPTKMLWEVWDAGTEFGSLSNQLICPPASCRRIDVTYRPAPEDVPDDPTLLVPPAAAAPKSGPQSPAGAPLPVNRPKD